MSENRHRIGILGGTLDPIHCGHLDIGRVAESTLGLTQVFVIPSNVPPHRSQTFASPFHRFAMAALAVADRPTWRACDLELRGTGPSYTAVTLTQLHARGHAPSDLYFIIGADAFADIATWHDYPAILDRAHFAVISRPGHAAGGLRRRLPAVASRMADAPLAPLADVEPLIILIDAATADVSSTEIRERRADGRPIDGLVPPAVQKHIEQHGLYSSTPPGRRRGDPPPDAAAGRLHGQS